MQRRQLLWRLGVLGTVGLAGMLVFENELLIFIAIGLFAVGLMAYPPVMQAFLMDLFRNESMGADLGAIRTIYIAFGSLGPTYVGYVADVKTYSLAFTGLVLCLIASAALVATSELLR